MYKLTDDEKSRLMDLAERNFWLSYSSGLKEAIFIVGDIQKMKNELFKIPQANIDLGQDTITIIASILDCGEFGGHVETIDIINNGDNNYTAIFHSDSIYCQEERSRLSENSKFNGLQVKASRNNLNVLLNAINSYKDNGVISNAPFEIAVLKKQDVLSHRIGIEWSSYIDFRMNTFRF